MKLFIDTSIFVDALRTKQVESSKSLFKSLQEGSNKAFTAVITVAELSVEEHTGLQEKMLWKRH